MPAKRRKRSAGPDREVLSWPMIPAWRWMPWGESPGSAPPAMPGSIPGTRPTTPNSCKSSGGSPHKSGGPLLLRHGHRRPRAGNGPGGGLLPGHHHPGTPGRPGVSAMTPSFWSPPMRKPLGSSPRCQKPHQPPEPGPGQGTDAVGEVDQ
jgi:hypothetical protein